MFTVFVDKFFHILIALFCIAPTVCFVKNFYVLFLTQQYKYGNNFVKSVQSFGIQNMSCFF